MRSGHGVWHGRGAGGKRMGGVERGEREEERWGGERERRERAVGRAMCQ